MYAVVSAIFAGVYSFLQKVAVERGFSPALINASTQLLVACMSFGAAFLYVGTNHWLLGVGLGVASGVTFMIGATSRMESLRFVDTAIFFPLYKTLGPLLTMVFGLVFFHEWFTSFELFGLLFGIAVPLLLLHKSEKSRQKDLVRGMVFLVVAAFFAAISSTIAKHGAEVLSSIFLYMAISESIGSIAGFTMYHMRDAKKDGGFVRNFFDKRFLSIIVPVGLLGLGSYGFLMAAFKAGGALAVVYTINSFYILIPIVLSIIVYKEHWNLRKALAIGLSIIALAFLG